MKKILIVDDSLTVRMALKEILEKAGYKTSLAIDEKTLFEQLDEELPDLILLDIIMPGMDGYEICKKIKSEKRAKDIPVIFLTSRIDDESIVKGFEAGANDYITKPPNERILIARIRAHLSEAEKKEVLLAAVTTANHEINQPLTILLGNVEMLFSKLRKRENLSDDYLDRKFESMINSIDKIKTIVKKFTSIKEIKLKEYMVDTEMLDLEQ